MVFDERTAQLVSVGLKNVQVNLAAAKSRLCHFGLYSTLLSAIWLNACPIQGQEPSISLKPKQTAASFTRVQTVVEVNGELKLNPDGRKVTKLPLRGKGELVYHERMVSPGSDEEPRRDARFYQSADARFVVGDGEIVTQLSDDRRLIGVQTSKLQSTVFSPSGPLTRDELELIDIQGSSSVLSRLLPDTEVAVGDKWSASNDTAAVLLRLDVITDNKLESEFKKIEDNLAFMELKGTVSGSVSGVPSDLEVTAKYNFDLKLQQITWLAMSIHENRSIGHAEPGFDVTARIRTSIAPLENSPELADEVVNHLPLNAEPGATFLTSLAAEGHFRLVYPRSWKVMVDRHDVTVMRFLDHGEMIAQCNLSKLADAPAGKLLSIDTLQADIQRSLDKNFGQFVEAKQFQTDRGLRALRVVAAGMASELPIQWIYYHLTDPKGRQAAIVFTLDAKLVERFGAEDHTLVSAFEIVPPPETKEPTAAAKTASKKNSP